MAEEKQVNRAESASNRAGSTRVLKQRGLEVRRIQKLRLSIVDSSGNTREPRVFARDEIVVGSDPAADFRLEDTTVSARHLSVRMGPFGWILTDAGSTNGTFINALRIHQAEIVGTTAVRLGETSLLIEPMGEHVEQELSTSGRFGRLIGTSPVMREMFAVLEKVAASDLTVLVEGETGTGKELAAEALHQSSGVTGAFVTLNCGAIPRDLIESELMGHVRGAFTGAVVDRPGCFVSADKGTLFLDEVAELPLDMQAKLLRVLEQQEVKAVGSDQVRRVAVRVVAATNRSLKVEVAEGRFRQDLYFRLAVVIVKVPPLRTRRSDLPELVSHIQAELNRRREAAGQAPYEPFGATALEMLARYDFPGNVRELRNIVERWSVLGAGTEIGGRHTARESELDSHVDNGLLALPYHQAKEAWVERFERAYVSHALQTADNNVSQAARNSQVDRRHLQRLMVRYDISRPIDNN